MTRRLLAKYWHLLALALLSALPLFWFKNGYLLYSEESAYLNYTFVWEKYRDLWSSHLNNGYTHYFYPYLFPQAPYWKLLTLLGASPVLIQRSFSVLIWALIVLSLYQLLKLFTTNRLLRVIGVSVYLLNPYLLTTVFYTAKIWQLILMPGAIFLTYRYLETRKKEYLVANFLLVYLFQGVFCNLPQAISAFLAYPITLLFFLVTKKTAPRKTIFSFCLFFLPLVPIIALNLWLYTLNLDPNELQASLEQNTFEALKTDPVKIMQFRGAWWEGKLGPEGIPYDTWSAFYRSPWIVGISLLIFSFTLLSLILRKFSRPYFFWLGVLLLFIFLAKGTANPAGNFFAFLYNKSVYFRIFREPWAKFVPWVILASTVLITISLNNLKTYWPKAARVVTPLFFGLVLARGYPFFTPKIIDHTNQGWKRMDVKIPSFWWAAQEWSKNHREENVFVIPEPVVTTKDQYFHWYPAQPGNFKGSLPFLLLDSNLQWNTDIDGFWTRSQNFSTFIHYFHPNAWYLLGTKYVLVMNDVRPTSTADLTFDKIAPFIKEEPNQVFGEGQLKIYEVKNDPPLIFSPKTEVAYFGEIDGLGATLGLIEPQMPTLIQSNPTPENLSPEEPVVISFLISDWKEPAQRVANECLYCATVKVPQTADYEILLYHPSFMPQKIVVRKTQLEPKSSRQNVNDWQTLGQVSLETGETAFQFIFPQPENVAGKEWEKLPIGQLTISGTSPEGETVKEDILSLQEIKNWESEGTYLVTFNYTGRGGIHLGEQIVNWDLVANPQTLTDFKQAPTLTRLSSSWILAESPQPKTIAFVVNADRLATKAWFLVGTTDPSSPPAVTDFQVKRLPDRQRIFLRKVSPVTPKELSPPQVEYKKLGETKYSVTISNAKDPFPLVFSQSYHQGWKLIPTGKTGNQPKEEHFLANGYANGWLINPADYGQKEKVEFLIEFAPQRIYLVGVVATALMAIISLVILLIKAFPSRIGREDHTLARRLWPPHCNLS